jgi:hypothetical protein
MSRSIRKFSAWFIGAGALISLSVLALPSMPRQAAATVTAFEGARLIVGDGSARLRMVSCLLTATVSRRSAEADRFRFLPALGVWT